MDEEYYNWVHFPEQENNMNTADNINQNWVIRTDELANKFEQGDISISKFSDDQLMWLIYYNFGCSGAHTTPETRIAEKELEFYRNNPYNQEYAQLIVDKAEEFY